MVYLKSGIVGHVLNLYLVVYVLSHLGRALADVGGERVMGEVGDGSGWFSRFLTQQGFCRKAR